MPLSLSSVSPVVLGFVALFVAVDILGLLPLYLTLTAGLTPEDRRRLPWQCALTAGAVGLGFLLVGQALFRVLGVTVGDFQVAGGLLLLVLSVSDLLRGPAASEEPDRTVGIVPLGTPLVVGPAVLTTLLLLVHTHGYGPTLIAYGANIFLVYMALHHAALVERVLGKAGSRAAGKVAGLFLAAFGVSLIRRGLPEFLGRQ
jgi:multiple antibiotic resistance protein